MSKMVQNPSYTTQKNNVDKDHAVKQSIQTTKTPINNETIINSFTAYDNNLGNQLKQLEREAEIQARQIELGECLKYVVQLIELFKHTVILSELQCQNGWNDDDTQHHLQQNKGVTGNRLLDDKVEKIVINKGLTKEQWDCLLYMAFSTGVSKEINKVSKKHLRKVHDIVSRLLEGNEQTAVFALINAIENYMSKDHFVDE